MRADTQTISIDAPYRAVAATAAVHEMEALHDAARLMRQHPPYVTPERVAARLRLKPSL